MKHLFPILAVLLMTACSKPDYTQTYKSLVEAYDVWIDQGDDNRALQMVDSIIDDCPDNIDARVMRAKILNYLERSDEALTDIIYASLNYRRHSINMRTEVYSEMGSIYQKIGDDKKAVKAMRRAIFWANIECRDDANEYRTDLALKYSQMGETDKEEKLYRTVLENNPLHSMAMVGLARVLIKKQEPEEALKWAERAQEISPQNDDTYRYKMQILNALGRPQEAINEALYYIAGYKEPLQSDIDLVLRYLTTDVEFAFQQIADIQTDFDDKKWECLRIELLKEIGNYREALESYDRMEEAEGPNSVYPAERASCYREMGLYDKAFAEMSRAIRIEEDPSLRNYFISSRGDILRRAARYDEAIEDYRLSLEYTPNSAYELYAIGFCYELMGDMDKALENYDLSIENDLLYTWSRLSRADILMERGHAIAARRDYQTILDLETEPRKDGCRHFALLGLGMEADAISWMEQVIEAYPYDSGTRYDYACLLARMGRPSQAMARLSEALELGYRDFPHMEHDQDLDPLRELPEYQALIEEYRDSLQIVPTSNWFGELI